MSLDKSKLLDAYIYEYLQALDCPRALTCWLLYAHGEHKQLAVIEFDPFHYRDLCSAQDSLAASKFLSKATFLRTHIDTKKVAIDSFFEAEAVCKETNRRIRKSTFENEYSAGVLMNMRHKITEILDGFTADEFVDSCNWGPGATTHLPRRRAMHPEKFTSERCISADAHDFVSPWFRIAYPNWDVDFDIKGSSKIVTVAKNAKTDRTIAIEPGLNLWFQKGIGNLFRRRLLRCGIDLNDQTNNQRKARTGSKFNDLATVDFSMASDTISRELVEQVMPHDWFLLIKAFRSNNGLLDGVPVQFEKFSSMGNGFTFELETLLFYTMALATCQILGIDSKSVTVYGDDVIIPSGAFDLYCAISLDLGFKVNRSKSYSASYYRESCGEYYWNGKRIKPIFLKEPFNGQTSVLKSVNSIRRSAHSRNSYGCDSRLRRPWQVLVDYLGPKCPRIPDGYGDLGIIENFDESEPYRKRADNGWEGYYIRVWAVQAVKLEFDCPGLNLYKLKSVSSLRTPVNFLQEMIEASSIGNDIPMPGRFQYARTRILVPRWAELGPWY